jgi:hypothetical protein
VPVAHLASLPASLPLFLGARLMCRRPVFCGGCPPPEQAQKLRNYRRNEAAMDKFVSWHCLDRGRDPTDFLTSRMLQRNAALLQVRLRISATHQCCHCSSRRWRPDLQRGSGHLPLDNVLARSKRASHKGRTATLCPGNVFSARGAARQGRPPSAERGHTSDAGKAKAGAEATVAGQVRQVRNGCAVCGIRTILSL